MLFPMCCRSRLVKNRVSEFMELITIRLTGHAFATTFIYLTSRKRTFWLLRQPGADVTTSAQAAVPAFGKSSRLAAESPEEKSRRSKNHAGPAIRHDSSPPQIKLRRNLAGSRNSSRLMLSSKALGNGTKNSHGATSNETAPCAVLSRQRNSFGA